MRMKAEKIGPLVIYDPNDPLADLYDFDDGMHTLEELALTCS
jgi:hypothetical protein